MIVERCRIYLSAYPLQTLLSTKGENQMGREKNKESVSSISVESSLFSKGIVALHVNPGAPIGCKLVTLG